MAYKLVVGFAAVGIINAVFIQETFKVAASDDTVMMRQKVACVATPPKLCGYRDVLIVEHKYIYNMEKLYTTCRWFNHSQTWQSFHCKGGLGPRVRTRSGTGVCTRRR